MPTTDGAAISTTCARVSPAAAPLCVSSVDAPVSVFPLCPLPSSVAAGAAVGESCALCACSCCWPARPRKPPSAPPSSAVTSMQAMSAGTLTPRRSLFGFCGRCVCCGVCWPFC